ncbi:MAG: glucosaminidase domain-containing protein [Minwuia sp.]|nr:glucosaminidase domain-containing protein [Minwuia sp.]
MKRIGRLAATAAVACAGFLLSTAAHSVEAAPTDESWNSRDLNSALIAAASGWESRKLAYDLAAVRKGDAAVPAVFVSRLPEELREIDDVRAMKRTFIRIVLPLILESNARLLAKRQQLMTLQSRLVRQDGELSAEQRNWLAELSDDYRVDAGEPEMQISGLLQRIDVVPPSLALAQAVTESGWGRSRFALRGNALYGQRTWSEGDGIVPRERADGASYEVRAFRSLLQSVQGYMRNINRHDAYDELRDRRAALRRAGKPVDGWTLAAGLTRYAETGQEYVEMLRTIIEVNRFRDFDDAWIEGASTARLGESAS